MKAKAKDKCRNCIWVRETVEADGTPVLFKRYYCGKPGYPEIEIYNPDMECVNEGEIDLWPDEIKNFELSQTHVIQIKIR